MLRENYYEILGLPPTANNQDIRKAYTTLALQYHPDKNESEDARDKFEAIQRAYETLSDTRKRNCYDASLYNEAQLSSTSFCGGVRYPDAPGGGTIITGDGWSFAINLNNVSVSKLVFTFAEDVADDESFVEHVHIKTDANAQSANESHFRRASKDREVSSRPGKSRLAAGGKGARGSGRRGSNIPGSSGSPSRAGDSRTQTSHDRASSGGGVTSVTVTPKRDAATTGANANANRSANGAATSRARRRKIPAAAGDRLKGVAGKQGLRGMATSPAGKRQGQRNSPKNRASAPYPEARQSASPSKLTSESRGSLQFARPAPSSKGLALPGRMSASADLKPKLYATRNFMGKITSDKNLFQKKSTTFPVRHTLFAVKSRVFTPLSRIGTRPEIGKSKESGGGAKRRKKGNAEKRNHGAKTQKKKVVETE